MAKLRTVGGHLGFPQSSTIDVKLWDKWGWAAKHSGLHTSFRTQPPLVQIKALEFFLKKTLDVAEL